MSVPATIYCRTCRAASAYTARWTRGGKSLEAVCVECEDVLTALPDSERFRQLAGEYKGGEAATPSLFDLIEEMP